MAQSALRGTRQCATGQEVAGSIPDWVIEIFQWLYPSGRSMALVVDSASNRKKYQKFLLGG